MVCWIANDTRLYCANCFPTDRVISNWNRCSHIHWPIYLLHWNMNQTTEICSYIKCRIRLNIDSKQIFNELCGIYGPQTISMRTIFRWVKAFKAGKFSVEDDTCPGRPKPLLPRLTKLFAGQSYQIFLSKEHTYSKKRVSFIVILMVKLYLFLCEMWLLCRSSICSLKNS